MAARIAASHQWADQVLVYGVMGNKTHFALENAVAEIEGGSRAQIVSSGLAACTTALLASLASGDHCLLPDSVYAPTRNFAETMLKRMGIITDYYPPDISSEALRPYFRQNTKVLFTESPGSHTFEVQDIPALSRLAHAHGARVLLDNTWGFSFFRPFDHGVDMSIVALTKYAAGHSDLLMGAITTANEENFRLSRRAVLELGQYASPDDCWLALRGIRTLSIRLTHQMKAGLEIARWFSTRPEVARVLHPALPGAPGHDLWKRDFTGASSLFSVEFQPVFTNESVNSFADSLALFGIGASWGGYESLVMPTNIPRTVTTPLRGPACRFHVGLEHVSDLIADLDQALQALHRTK